MEAGSLHNSSKEDMVCLVSRSGMADLGFVPSLKAICHAYIKRSIPFLRDEIRTVVPFQPHIPEGRMENHGVE